MKKLFSILTLWSMLLAQGSAQQQMDRLDTKGVNKLIQYSASWSGATPDAKIVSMLASPDCTTASCQLSLSGLVGAQTFSSGITFPSTKTTAIYLGDATISGPCPLFDMSNAADGSMLIGLSTGYDLLTGSTYGTKLVCTSGTDAVKVGLGSTTVSRGLRVENLAANCNSIAARGFTIDNVQSSTFRNLTASNCTAIGVSLKATTALANTNLSWNAFSQISGRNNPVGLQLDGNATGSSDITQNTFLQLNFSFTGAAGILINSADNNWFYGVQAFRTSGTGTAMVFASPITGSTVGGIGNKVYGLLGGVATASSANFQAGTFDNEIEGYDYSNGEAQPILGTAAATSAIVNGSRLSGSNNPISPTGINPGFDHWFYSQGNCGNPPNGNPTLLQAGLATCWNFSNGLGEVDFMLAPGAGSVGGLRWYNAASGGSTNTLIGDMNSAGLVGFGGANAITVTPPIASVPASVGWKQCWYSNIYCDGVANNTLVFAISSGGWLSTFAGNPANNATLTVPDTAAGASLNTNGTVWGAAYQTATNCASPVGTCGSAAAGAVTIAAGASTVTVSTTRITANSEILLSRDNSLGTRLAVTCNTQSSLVLGTPYVSARVAGTSFTITIDAAPTTNPLCMNYSIVN